MDIFHPASKMFKSGWMSDEICLETFSALECSLGPVNSSGLNYRKYKLLLF